MSKIGKVGFIAVTVAVLAWVPPAFSRGAGGVESPLIDGATVDSGRQYVTVFGRKFGTATPELMLGAERLEVVESTEDKVIAKLPVRLVPATYKLSVRNARSSREAPSLFLQIP